MLNCDRINWTEIPNSLNNVQGASAAVFGGHVQYASLLLPPLLERIGGREERTVVSLFGGSGCGKTGTAAALGWGLRRLGIDSIVVGGDHFPRRIPMENDAERLSRFRRAGLKSLVRHGLYSQTIQEMLNVLWRQNMDADASMTSQYPWLREYRDAGREALALYLGTPEEQDFDMANGILDDFHRGRQLWLPSLGRTDFSYSFRNYDASQTSLVILEWTHGGSEYLHGIDYMIYLDSTPESTRAARRLRGRDENTDSPFTTMVLEIEQEAILRRIPFADIVLKDGKVM